LFEDGFGGFFLLVGRVAVFAEDEVDHGAELGLDAFFLGPIDGGVLMDHVHELLRCEAELFAALIASAHVFREIDQFLKDLGRFNGAVLVFADGFFEHLGEEAGLSEILFGADL